MRRWPIESRGPSKGGNVCFCVHGVYDGGERVYTHKLCAAERTLTSLGMTIIIHTDGDDDDDDDDRVPLE